MRERVNEYEKMFVVESELWWYRILHYLVIQNINDLKPGTDWSILDAGCGTGGMMKSLIRSGYQNVEGFDFSSHAVSFTNNSGMAAVEMDLNNFTENVLNNKFDVIVSNDTLCYFETRKHQLKIIDNLYANLNEGGFLVMNLTAFDSFAGIHDIAVGLKKRFHPNELRELFNHEKFILHRRIIWPFLLSPLVYWKRRNQRHVMKNGDFEINSDIDIPWKPLNTLLYFITRLEIACYSGWPWGSSMLVVLEKKST